MFWGVTPMRCTQNPTPEPLNSAYETVTHACMQDVIDAALLQQHQVDIDCVDETAKWTALHYAVAGHKQAMVKQLLDAGAAADIAAPGGIRPLHLACAGPITTASTRSKICLAHFYDQQQLWKKAGPGSSAVVKLLLAAGKVGSKGCSLLSGTACFE